MSPFIKWQEDNVLSAHNDNSVDKALSFEEKFYQNKNWKSRFFLKWKWYNYYHEIEEECRKIRPEQINMQRMIK